MGTQTYIPQNDPHDALIVLKNIQVGEKNFQKKLPISSGSPSAKVQPGGQVGGQFFCLYFSSSPPPSQTPLSFQTRLSPI